MANDVIKAYTERNIILLCQLKKTLVRKREIKKIKKKGVGQRNPLCFYLR